MWSGAGDGGGMGGLFTARGAERWLLFVAAWLVLGETDPAGIVAGALAAAIAALLSLRLLPPGSRRFSWRFLPRFAARFLVRSVAAGWDVAHRVAARTPRITPGTLTVPCAIPTGISRDAFRAIASLQPGVLPLPGEGQNLTVHCLDTRTPVAAEMAKDADAFLRLAGSPRHG